MLTLEQDLERIASGINYRDVEYSIADRRRVSAEQAAYKEWIKQLFDRNSGMVLVCNALNYGVFGEEFSKQAPTTFYSIEEWEKAIESLEWWAWHDMCSNGYGDGTIDPRWYTPEVQNCQ